MSLCTVVIPTLQAANLEVTDILVNELQNNSKLVDRLIFINNALDDKFTKRYENHSKVEVIHDKPNLMVNPAWNFGLSLVKTKYYCLLNDDVCFHGQVIDGVIEILEKNENLNLSTVFSHKTFDINFIKKHMKENEYNSNHIFYIKKYPEEIKQGWFMLARTADWIKIPVGCMVFSGDDHIFIANQSKYAGACLVENNCIYHMESSTVWKHREPKQEYIKKYSKPFDQNLITEWL